jgi:DNA-binding beta-propeller fold protein YncE
MHIYQTWRRWPSIIVGACALALAALSGARAEGPALKVDPTWPKQLPNNWILGQVGGMFIDAQDHIWVFQRPRSLTNDEKAATLKPPRSKCCAPAPSVLVFDTAGNVVKSWGGPGENLGYDWPLQEHGIFIDHKGFVWLSGNGKGDSMVLKFTQDGEFVKQLGRAGPLTSSKDTSQFGLVANFAEDAAANELYLADGYGNHRVVVIDEDTGAVKRMWGAYGKPPTDENLPLYNTEAQQFANPVHCIVISNDNQVFVCDRSNNRVQVFQKDGTFVRQYVFDPATQGSGSTWGVAFSPLDKSQDYFLVTDGSNNVIETVRRKDGAVVGTVGHQGRGVGEFHWVHVSNFDSHGNLYTGEVDTGKRLQKWVPAQ